MKFLKKLFGRGEPEPDLNAWKQAGALVLDVRTKGEYAQGHVEGSRNIPLDELAGRLKDLPTDRPIITCCASGMRSGAAARLLRSRGIKQVHNGGPWQRLQQ